MRESIKKRIDDLDSFYEENFDDEFITYFEKGRYKLKKLVQYEPNLINEIDNGNNMKAYILGQNSKDNIYEQDYGIKKNKNNSKTYKIYDQNYLMKLKNENENLNKYINANQTKVNNTSKRNLRRKYNDKNYKWQKDLKNRIYNNYYNKDIRKKYSYLNSDDSGANNKENKVKYMDWTENNSIQGNTISVKSNKISNSTHSNFNIQKKLNNNKFNNFVKDLKDNNELNEEELINMNFLDNSNHNSKSSKSEKIMDFTEENELTKNIKDIINREILFEIKLTKDEYNMLMKQKKSKIK